MGNQEVPTAERAFQPRPASACPGPWTIHHGVRGFGIIRDADGNVVCSFGDIRTSRDVSLAAANLIAGGPDMLSAHRANAADLLWLSDNIDAEEPLSEAAFGRIVACLNRCNAALSKAEAV